MATTNEPPHAYQNADFLESRDGRSLRIMSEYMEPLSRFTRHKIDDTVVFMGSARTRSRESALQELETARRDGGDIAFAERQLELSVYYEAARTLAHRLTVWSKDLGDDDRRFVVCTGGGPGIMEAANRGASEADGLNVGLTISIPVEEFNNPHITRELHLNFHYFFMRKFWFLYLAKAMVFFPGGFGTLDELFETLTLVQTGKIRKRLPMVLFGASYWNDVINMDALVRYGTISEKDIDLMMRTDSVDEAFEFITNELITYNLDRPGAVL